MGLLDFANMQPGQGGLSQQDAGLLALASGLIKGDFGGGLMGYQQAMNPENELRRKLMQAQVGNYESEIEQRKAATQKLTEGLGFINKLLTKTGAPQYSPGQLGSGSVGILPNNNPLSPGVSGPTGLAAATPEDIAMAKLYGTDLMEPWKVAKEGFEQKPGTFRVDASTGRQTFVPDPSKNIDFDPQTKKVSLLPGAGDATMALGFAQKLPETLLGSAGRVNLRENPDGTKSPVVELNENPLLSGLIGRFIDGKTAPQSAPVHQSMAATGGLVNQGGGRLTPELQNLITQDAAKNGITNPTVNMTGGSPNATYGLSNAPVSVQSASGGTPRYGMSTAQQAAAKATEETAVQTAKDVAETRKNIMNAGFVAPTNIAKYQQLGKLLENIDGGTLTATGTHLASTMNSLGIKIDKNLPNKEAAAALANQMALELRNPAGGAGMPGALSDSDRNFLTAMVPSASQSMQGRKQLIDAYIAVQQRNQQVSSFARNYEKKYGKLDNGFFDQMQAWSESNPLFKAQ